MKFVVSLCMHSVVQTTLERQHNEFYVEGIYSMRFVTGKIGFYEPQAHQITAPSEQGPQVAPPRRHRKIFHVMCNHGSNIMVQIFSKDTYYGIPAQTVFLSVYCVIAVIFGPFQFLCKLLVSINYSSDYIVTL